jgi:hypothetical protein
MEITVEKRIAELIEKGLVANGIRIQETKGVWLFVPQGMTAYACILGIALVGKCGNVFNARKEYHAKLDEMIEVNGEKVKKPLLLIFAELLDCDLGLAKRIAAAHLNSMSAAKIAEALRNGTL